MPTITQEKNQRQITDTTRKKISEGRKRWLKTNPDKHPWRNKNKFVSQPCEKVKEFLTSLNILFISEYQPEINGRFFSIDIALPDKMIALEINGNQHYERDGALKPYYQERHDILESNGWNVFEIHYSACFNIEKWADFINQIKNASTKIEFDYFTYQPRKRLFRSGYGPCPECSKEKCNKAAFCRSCRSKKKIGMHYQPRKPTTFKSVISLSVEEMTQLIKNTGLEKISRQLGVTVKTILRFCQQYNITRPQKTHQVCNDCGRKIKLTSKACKKCHQYNQNKKWPTPEEIQKLVWEISTSAIAKKLGVSDQAVAKFCQKHNLTKPPRGYWRKIACGIVIK